MTTLEFLASLAKSGIDVWREGDRLRYRALAGAVTAELRAEMAARRAELLEVVPRLASGEAPFGLTPSEVDEFRRLNVAVKFRSTMAGDFWLVPSYTRQARPEVTPEDVGRLWLLLKTFPGSTVESFTWLRGAPAPAADHPPQEDPDHDPS